MTRSAARIKIYVIDMLFHQCQLRKLPLHNTICLLTKKYFGILSYLQSFVTTSCKQITRLKGSSFQGCLSVFFMFGGCLFGFVIKLLTLGLSIELGWSFEHRLHYRGWVSYWKRRNLDVNTVCILFLVYWDIAWSSYWFNTVVQNDQVEKKKKEKMPKITAITLCSVFDLIFKGG